MRLDEPARRTSTTTAAVAPAFAQGAKALAPIAASVAPFGLAVGTAASAAHIPTLVGWLTAPLILAGTAQLTAIEMLDAGASPVVIIISALVVNARLVMYGAALAPTFREEPLGRRMLLAVPLIDQMYLATAARFEQGDLDRQGRQAYWTGGAVVLVSTWVIAHTIGMAAGSSLPTGSGLQAAAPLALAALLAKSLTSRRAVVAAVIAGVVAVVGVELPYQSAVLVAASVGVAVAWSIGERLPEPETAP